MSEPPRLVPGHTEPLPDILRHPGGTVTPGNPLRQGALDPGYEVGLPRPAAVTERQAVGGPGPGE